MNLEHLQAIRINELDGVLSEISRIFPDSASISILEIGAGTGWQAKVLTENGYNVEAIDIENSNYFSNTVWPITYYDGEKIPFSDNRFDLIFSSNVLEHIPHLDEFHSEMHRVLKADGIALHLVPSGSWRFWTSITHYLSKIKNILLVPGLWSMLKKNNDLVKSSTGSCRVGPANTSKTNLPAIPVSLFPPRHGETGNFATEIYHFSRYKWTRIFKSGCWSIISAHPSHLFYTGKAFLGSGLSIRLRIFASYLLGSSCHVYLLRNSPCNK